jgi:hypothetical protein
MTVDLRGVSYNLRAQGGTLTHCDVVDWLERPEFEWFRILPVLAGSDVRSRFGMCLAWLCGTRDRSLCRVLVMLDL